MSPAGLLLVTSALIIGVSKTSVGGIAVLAVAAFATVMPAKESTAAVLLLLIMGDIVAVARYRRVGDWSLLRRLLPSVLPGVAVGALFLHAVDDDTLRLALGIILTVMVALQLVLRVRRGAITDRRVRTPHPAISVAAGGAAGFTTMTANAAGPVMTLYLLAARVDKHAFVGTNAVFFLLVNLAKTPFSAGLGLFPATTLTLTLLLAPFVLAGTWIGTRIVGRVSQETFDRLALAAAALAAGALLVR